MTWSRVPAGVPTGGEFAASHRSEAGLSLGASPGCPYVAGPACAGCSGSCWDVGAPQQPEPEPCQGCSMIVGGATYCEGRCEGMTSEADFEERCAAYLREQEEPADAVPAPPVMPERLRIDDYFDGGVADYVRTPWVRDDTHISLVPSDWAAQPVEPVPTAGLCRTQSRVFKKHLARHLAGVGAPDGGGKPWVVFYRGHGWVIDGHHRFVAAILRGEATLDAHVMYVEPGEGRVR